MGNLLRKSSQKSWRKASALNIPFEKISTVTNSIRRLTLNICFVTDGGVQIGMGHILQSTSLARGLQEYASISFVTKSNEIVVETIQDFGYEVTNLRDDSEIFEFLEKLNPEVIIFDKTDVAEWLAKEIRIKLNSRLVILTNLTEANKYADIAVLPRAKDLRDDPSKRFTNHSYTCPDTNTLYFYGPKYWILRPEFIDYKARNKPLPAAINRILLSFGGSDPTNLACQVLETILEMDGAFSIDVVLGKQFGFHQQVKVIIDNFKHSRSSVVLHSNARNMADLMYSADLAVTAAGMTMFEALCVRTPVIVVPQDQLQRDTYNGFIRTIEIDELHTLAAMILNFDFTRPTDQAIVNMNIGIGVGELIDAIIDQ